jgi:PRTRC genetic system ThiF family protein
MIYQQLNLNLDSIDSKPIILPEFDKALIYLIGCGGTGSFLAPHLCRLAYYLHQTKDIQLQLKFVDFDVVEEKNLLRQNFCTADLRWNKAIALTKRYATAFPYLNLTAICEPIEDLDLEGCFNSCPTIFIGCVDNNAARRYLHQIVKYYSEYSRFDCPDRLWWLDCGNSYSSGQVLLGSSITTDPKYYQFSPISCLRLPAPSLQCPDLLMPEEEAEPVSCAEFQLLGMQSLHINSQMAVVAAEMLTQLLDSQLRRMQAYIDLDRGITHSTWITKANIDRIIPKDYSKTPHILMGTYRRDRSRK